MSGLNGCEFGCVFFAQTIWVQREQPSSENGRGETHTTDKLKASFSPSAGLFGLHANGAEGTANDREMQEG